jgi:hypothetical protein
MHELSESTKRLIDAASAAAVAAASGTAALTLSDWALLVTILAGLLSAAWQLMRFYDRWKYGHGHSRDENAA